MLIFLTILLGLVTIYVMLVFGIIGVTILKQSRPAPPPPSTLPRISVVVAARNEERNLPGCLEALAAQSYPHGRIEIIVANDHSTDGTAGVVQSFRMRHPHIRAVHVSDSPSLKGKARALHEAIVQSEGEIILVTDADCRPPRDWAVNMVSYFGDEKVGVVCGVTLIDDRTVLDRVQALDWLFLLAVASTAVEIGIPITAMGNNMGLRREAYFAVGGYPALPFSVTEDYALFKSIHRAGNWRVRLPVDPSLRNVTLPLKSLSAIFSQRKRWARGGLKAPAWVFGIYVFGVLNNLLVVAGLFLLPIAGAAAFALKISAEFALLAVMCNIFGTRRSLLGYPAFALYFLFYLIIMPFSLLLAPRIRWKGRRF